MRLYAEDPLNGFLPTPGHLICFSPATVEVRIDFYRHIYIQGVRYDSGVESGSEISIFYDPMVAKIISWGRDRNMALQRLRKALAETAVVGLTTNQNFLLHVRLSSFLFCCSYPGSRTP